ncbi:unnamed protein product [Closterium sp. Naga37s-1]|nr:unnamed protein product [Closterium sp. Naga37s-1]
MELKQLPSLVGLPESIGHLGGLRVLEVEGCDALREVPESWAHLSGLERLCVNGARHLTILPPFRVASSALGVGGGNAGGLRAVGLVGFGLLERRERHRSLDELSLEDASTSAAAAADAHSDAAHASAVSTLFGLNAPAPAFPTTNTLSNTTRSPSFAAAATAAAAAAAAAAAPGPYSFHGLPLPLTNPPHLSATLSSLRFLEISDCASLTSLPEDLGQLPALDTLLLLKLPSLERLPDFLGQLPALKVFGLSLCPRLEELPVSMANLPVLQCLVIHDCWRLASLPPNALKQWETLTELIVADCPALDDLGFGLEGAEGEREGGRKRRRWAGAGWRRVRGGGMEGAGRGEGSGMGRRRVGKAAVDDDDDEFEGDSSDEEDDESYVSDEEEEEESETDDDEEGNGSENEEETWDDDSPVHFPFPTTSTATGTSTFRSPHIPSSSSSPSSSASFRPARHLHHYERVLSRLSHLHYLEGWLSGSPPLLAYFENSFPHGLYSSLRLSAAPGPSPASFNLPPSSSPSAACNPLLSVIPPPPPASASLATTTATTAAGAATRTTNRVLGGALPRLHILVVDGCGLDYLPPSLLQLPEVKAIGFCGRHGVGFRDKQAPGREGFSHHACGSLDHFHMYVRHTRFCCRHCGAKSPGLFRGIKVSPDLFRGIKVARLLVAAPFLLAFLLASLTSPVLIPVFLLAAAAMLFASLLASWVRSRDDGGNTLRQVTAAVQRGASTLRAAVTAAAAKAVLVATMLVALIHLSHQLSPQQEATGVHRSLLAFVTAAVQRGASTLRAAVTAAAAKAVLVATMLVALIHLSHQLSPQQEATGVHRSLLAFVSLLSFLLGGSCMALAAHAAVWVSVPAAARIAAAARRSPQEALQVKKRMLSSRCSPSFLLGGSCMALAAHAAVWVSVPAAARIATAARRSPQEALQVKEQRHCHFASLLSFLLGGFCMTLAAHAAVWLSVLAAARIAVAARRSPQEALQVAIRAAGAAALVVAAVPVVGLGINYSALLAFFFLSCTIPHAYAGAAALVVAAVPVVGLGINYSALLAFFHMHLAPLPASLAAQKRRGLSATVASAATAGSAMASAGLKPTDLPALLVCFCFGAAVVSLFYHLPPSIFSRSLALGHKLISRMDRSASEAAGGGANVVAVADMVGVGMARGAARACEAFCLAAAEAVASMVLGAHVAQHCAIDSSLAAAEAVASMVLGAHVAQHCAIDSSLAAAEAVASMVLGAHVAQHCAIDSSLAAAEAVASMVLGAHVAQHCAIDSSLAAAEAVASMVLGAHVAQHCAIDSSLAAAEAVASMTPHMSSSTLHAPPSCPSLPSLPSLPSPY